MMSKTEKIERDSKIRKWFKEGVSQEEIGVRLSLTRQRVQQLEQDIGLSRGKLRVKKEYSHKCDTCNKKFTSNKQVRKFCSRECFRLSRIQKLTPAELKAKEEERKQKNREKARSYYHNVFKKRKDWQQIVKERNDKYYASHPTH